MKTLLRTTLITLAVAGVAACGAKGPLFLPEPAEPVLTAPETLPGQPDVVAPTAPLGDLDTREPVAPPPVDAEDLDDDEEATPPPPRTGDG